MEIRSFLAMVLCLTPPLPAAAGEEMPKVKQATLELKEKMLAEFPELRAEPRPVPEERNGFLALLRLGGQDSALRGLKEEFGNLIGGRAPWDAAAVRAGLETHAKAVAECERIAAMDSRSSVNLPVRHLGFFDVRPATRAADLLIAKARLAAEAGDGKETLRLVVAAQNLASHLREVEAPNMMAETGVIAIDRNIQSAAFEHLLPALGRDADLVSWRSALFPRPYDPASFAKVMRGEWDITAEFMLIPALSVENDPERPPDPEELVRAYSSVYHEVVSNIPRLSVKELSDATDMMGIKEGRFPGLSDPSRDLLKMFCSSNLTWVKSWVRAAAVSARNRAALDLLIREKEGRAGEPGVDPLSGRPFVFDPESRTLAMPEANFEREIEPLKLPW